MKKKFMPPIHN